MVAPLLIPLALELAKVAAPGLIKLLSGSDKAAEVAEQVITLAQEVTGSGDGEAALTKLRADPNLVLQMQARSNEIAAAYELALIDDRKDARKRDVELQKMGSPNTRANMMIAGDVIGMLCCLVAMVYTTWLGVTGGADSDATPLIMALNGPLGMLTQQFANGLRDAHQFEFGSSRSSSEKTEMLWKGSPK